MNLAVRTPMTLAEFLVWEERQPLRYEFDGVDPVAMTGGTAGHVDIQANLAAAFRTRLRGDPCRFCGSDLKFQVADGNVRYPDGMVVCSPLDRTATVVYGPVIVFEILSPSTAKDRIGKPANISDAVHSALRHARTGQHRRDRLRPRADDSWTHEILIADYVLALPETGVELPLAELYEGNVFDDEPDGGQPPAEAPA